MCYFDQHLPLHQGWIRHGPIRQTMRLWTKEQINCISPFLLLWRFWCWLVLPVSWKWRLYCSRCFQTAHTWWCGYMDFGGLDSFTGRCFSWRSRSIFKGLEVNNSLLKKRNIINSTVLLCFFSLFKIQINIHDTFMYYSSHLHCNNRYVSQFRWVLHQTVDGIIFCLESECPHHAVREVLIEKKISYFLPLQL